MYYALVIIESGKLEPTHGNHQNRYWLIFRSDCCKAPDQLHSLIANTFNIPKFIHFFILNVILCNFVNKSVDCEEVIYKYNFLFLCFLADIPCRVIWWLCKPNTFCYIRRYSRILSINTQRDINNNVLSFVLNIIFLST